LDLHQVPKMTNTDKKPF